MYRNVIVLSLTIFILVILVLFTSIIKNNNQIGKDVSSISCKDCNVILISLDTLRSKSLPCYGYEKNTAPNLCNFANESIIFNKAYSQSSYTLDSHFSLMTSLYPSSHMVITPLKDTLSPDIKTLAQVLRENGYQTSYGGVLNSPNLPLDRGLERGFDKLISARNPKEWINLLKTETSKDKKFFTFLHTYYVHDPYTPKKENTSGFYTDELPEYYQNEDVLCNDAYNYLLAKNRDLFNYPIKNVSCDDLYKEIGSDVGGGSKSSLIFSTKSKLYYDKVAENPELRKGLYDTEIYELDQQLGDFINYIKNSGLLKNTIIIITSDHGEAFMEHGNWLHANDLYNETIKIPLFIYVPNQNGRKIDKPVELIDVFPTIMALLNIDFPVQLQGNNLLSEVVNKWVFSELFIDRKKAVINDKWKLIINYVEGNKTYELYNIENDFDEKHNLFYKERKIADEMIDILDIHLESRRNYSSTESVFPDWVNEETRKHLIEKGYF